MIRIILVAAALAASVTTASAARHPDKADSGWQWPAASAAWDHPVEIARSGHHHRHRHHVSRAAHTRPAPAASSPAPAVSPAPVASQEAPVPASPLSAIIGPVAALAASPLAEIVEATNLAIDRFYLVATACPGYTMSRQGTLVAVGRLNPVFVRRLADTIRDARGRGIRACIFSAYRPPGYGVGGFADKFNSAHAYGLAVDMGGIGSAGSSSAIAFAKLAAVHGVYDPYGPYNRAEWNHYQPCRVKMVTMAAPLRRTITSFAPIVLATMWKAAETIISPIGLSPTVSSEPHRTHKIQVALHHHRHYAKL